MSECKSSINEWNVFANEISGNKNFAPNGVVEHAHYSQRQITEYFNENDPIFYHLQVQNEQLEGLFYQWQIDFEVAFMNYMINIIFRKY